MAFMRSHSMVQTNQVALKPRFHIETIQDDNGTFRDEERVEIVIPGNPFTRPVRVVTDEHRQRWPQEYAAFKSQTTMAAAGFPIEHWPALTKAQVRMLKFFDVHTVEDCAGLDDQALQRIGMGARNIKNAAAAYLDDAERAKLITEQARAGEMKDQQIATLTEQVRQLGEAIARMQHEQQQARAAAPADTFIPGVVGFGVPVPPPAPESPLASFEAPKRRGRASGAGNAADSSEEAAA